MGFSIRKTTDNWQQLSKLGTKRVHKAFNEANVDVVLTADETFISKLVDL